MSVDQRHPLFVQRVLQWEKMYDSHKGEDQIKAKGRTYLPPTRGMEIDGLSAGQPGYNSFIRYRDRAVYHDFVKNAVEGCLGLMHREPATIEVPPQLEEMLDSMTVDGESAQMLLRKINEYQLIYGRLGLLLEAPDNVPVNEALPFVAVYDPRSIINWDDGRREQGQQDLELVVLDESEFERESRFIWEYETKYRVLIRADSAEIEMSEDQSPVGEGTYGVATFRDGQTSFDPTMLTFPAIGGNTMERLPFVFVNTNDLVTDPDDPPFLGLANLALAIYRGEADLRQALHNQGQDTLVIIGGKLDKDARIGAGAKIELKENGDAKFIGVDSDGLSEQREVLSQDKAAAGEMTQKLLDRDGGSTQSGEALRVRMGSKTATLSQIAKTGAEGLKSILQMAAEWVGADPEAVVVEPNLDFADEELTGQNMLQMIQAKDSGFPISEQSLHRIAKKRDLTVLEYEEEKELIDAEREERMAQGLADGMGGSGAPGEGIEPPASPNELQDPPDEEDPEE